MQLEETRASQSLTRPLVLGILLGVMLSGTLTGVALLTRGPSPAMAVTCEHVMPKLAAYREQSLDPEWTQIVATHLTNCKNCTAAYERLMQATAEDGRWNQYLLASAPPSRFRSGQ